MRSNRSVLEIRISFIERENEKMKRILSEMDNFIREQQKSWSEFPGEQGRACAGSALEQVAWKLSQLQRP